MSLGQDVINRIRSGLCISETDATNIVNKLNALGDASVPTATLGATTTTTLAAAGRVTTTDGVTSGTARVVGGLAYSSTAASTAVASTSAETLFDTFYTMPADTLKAGTVVKIRYQGIATATIGSDTLGVKLYIGGLGGTALISAAAVDAADNMTFSGEFHLICRTAGTSGTMVGTGLYKTTAAEGTATMKDDILASTAINTTASQVIGVGATWNNTNANSCRLDILSVEIE